MAYEKMTCRIEGMACTGCAGGIERSIGKLDGVQSIEVDFGAGRASIIYAPERTNCDKLADAIRSMGYDVDEVRAE